VFDVAVISSDNESNITQTSVVLSCVTDTPTGQAYVVIVPFGDPTPTAQQIKDGQNAAGTPAIGAANTTVTSTNIIYPAITGLTQNTQYNTHYVQEAAAVVVGNVYYVSFTNGNDAWTGENQTNAPAGTGPKQTLSGAQSLLSAANPGDQVLMERGNTWNGSFGSLGSPNGALNNHVVLGAYGSGALPIIDGGTGITVNCTNSSIMSYFTMQDIDLRATGSNNVCFFFWSNNAANIMHHISFINVTFRDAGGSGISMRNDIDITSLNNIIIDACTFSNISVNGFIPYHVSDLTVKNSTFTNIGVTNREWAMYISKECTNVVLDGNNISASSGGIKMRDGNNYTASNNTITNIDNVGLSMGMGNDAGLEFGASTNYLAENNNIIDCGNYYIAIDNQDSTTSLVEGDGVIVRYNNIVMDTNVSVCRGIRLTDRWRNVEVYNNTVTTDRPTGVCLEVNANNVNNAFFENNILYKNSTTSTREVVEVSGTQTNMMFDYNNYYTNTGSIADIGGVTYGNLAAWQAAYPLQNINSNQGNPNLANPLTDNQLTASSTLCINLAKTQTGHPNRDILGNTVPFGAAVDMGAYERQA